MLQAYNFKDQTKLDKTSFMFGHPNVDLKGKPKVKSDYTKTFSAQDFQQTVFTFQTFGTNNK